MDTVYAGESPLSRCDDFLLDKATAVTWRLMKRDMLLERTLYRLPIELTNSSGGEVLFILPDYDDIDIALISVNSKQGQVLDISWETQEEDGAYSDIRPDDVAHSLTLAVDHMLDSLSALRESRSAQQSFSPGGM